ncbi:MAG: hypothetical protein D6800_13970, partial [Candidatus Zixiibacteriota bacterium]
MHGEQRFKEQNLDDHSWNVFEGFVLASLPQYGYHIVSVNGLNSVKPAQAIGVNDVWGSHTIRNIQAGTSVIVATHPMTEQAIILGNTAPAAGRPADEFLTYAFAGSNSGASEDPFVKEYVEKTQEDARLMAFATNSFVDQQAGDWGCRTDTGVTLLVDSFGVQISVDEVTGLWIDILDQRFELSARKLNLQTDGVVLRNTNAGDISVFALGRSAYRTDQIKTVLYKDRNQYAEKLSGWVVDAQSKGEKPTDIPPDYDLAYAYSTVVVNEGYVGTIHHGKTWMEASPAGIRAISGRMSGLFSSLPGFYEYVDSAPIDPRQYPLRGVAVKQAAVSMKGSTVPDTASPFIQIAAAFAESFAPFEWRADLLGDSLEYRIIDNPNWFGEVTEDELEDLEDIGVAEAVDKYESYIEKYRRQPGSKPAYWAPMVKSQQQYLSAVTVDEDTGDITIFNEQGAGIRIVGSTIYLEGLQVRVSTVKDIVMLGRDVNLLANRDVAVSSSRTTRVFSEKNVNILGGNSGRGGVFIESRSIGTKIDVGDSPSDDEFVGVIIKSRQAPVSILGGDILVKAGERRAGTFGDVIIHAEQGRVVTSGNYGVIQHTQGRITQTFGKEWHQFSRANTFSRYTTTLGSALYCVQLDVKRTISAGSHIQTKGLLGHNSNNRVGKVLPEFIRYIDSVIRERDEETIDPGKGRVRDNIRQMKEKHVDGQGLLGVDAYINLSSGWPEVQGQGDGGSGYNASVIQSTVQAELFQSFAPI